MGNMGLTLEGCKNCKNVDRENQNHDMNQVSSYYTNRLADIQQIKSGVPYYPNELHMRLVNDLKLRGQTFQDMIHPNQHLLRNTLITWRRVSQVYPNQPFSKSQNNYNFTYNTKTNKKSLKLSKLPTISQNLDEALLTLKNYPELVNKIFPNNQLSKEGIYVLYFCQGGNIHKRKQIVIDDYIPVDSEGAYFFEEPAKGDGIWMILVKKAWAKILTSYHHLEHLPAEYFLAEMTGVPKQSFYQQGDFLVSAKHDLNMGQSKYLKIFRDSPVQMIVCIWEQVNPDFLREINQPELVVQIILEIMSSTGKEYKLFPTQTQRLSNKLLITALKTTSMFQLPQGQSIIHLYNRSRSKRTLNIVLHSRKPVTAHARYERQFQQAKKIMIKNQYRKLYNQISVQFQHPQIQTKFCWIQHRGIFCLRNKAMERKKITMTIKKMFFSDIVFEDSAQFVKSVTLGNGEHGFFVVIRAENQEYGHFYDIVVQRVN